MPFLTITLYSYGFFAILLISVYLAYNWLNKNKKPGCISVGFTSLIIFFFLIFLYTISISLFTKENEVVKYSVLVFWTILIGSYIFALIFGKTNDLWNLIITVLKYLLISIFVGLFCILYFGMFYFLYKIFFTNEEDNFELWTGIICVIFTSVLTVIIFSIPTMEKQFKEKSTFYNLNKAIKNPDDVTRLDLSTQNLTSFPVEILKMKNVKHLDLSNNTITHIPFEIKNLKKLETLYLKNNPIDVGTKNSLRKEFTKINIQF